MTVILHSVLFVNIQRVVLFQTRSPGTMCSSLARWAIAMRNKNSSPGRVPRREARLARLAARSPTSCYYCIDKAYRTYNGRAKQVPYEIPTEPLFQQHLLCFGISTHSHDPNSRRRRGRRREKSNGTHNHQARGVSSASMDKAARHHQSSTRRMSAGSRPMLRAQNVSRVMDEKKKTRSETMMGQNYNGARHGMSTRRLQLLSDKFHPDVPLYSALGAGPWNRKSPLQVVPRC